MEELAVSAPVTQVAAISAVNQGHSAQEEQAGEVVADHLTQEEQVEEAVADHLTQEEQAEEAVADHLFHELQEEEVVEDHLTDQAAQVQADLADLEVPAAEVAGLSNLAWEVSTIGTSIGKCQRIFFHGMAPGKHTNASGI